MNNLELIKYFFKFDNINTKLNIRHISRLINFGGTLRKLLRATFDSEDNECYDEASTIFKQNQRKLVTGQLSNFVIETNRIFIPFV